MNAPEKAARILEQLSLCGFGKMTIEPLGVQEHGEPPATLHTLWADECMIARTCFAPGSHINAQRLAESWNLAPAVATALIDAHAEIERLKGAARAVIKSHEAYTDGDMSCPIGHEDIRADYTAFSAALDALKEITG